MLTVIKVAKKENIKFTFVPHSGDIEVVRFVMGGHIPFGHVSYGSAKPHIEAGTLKALASFSEKRLESMPQVPTFAELGYDPGHYPSFGWYAPRDTPDSIIQKIYGVVQKASNTTAYIEKVRNLGFLPAFANSDQYQNDLKKYAIDIGSALKELGYVKN